MRSSLARPVGRVGRKQADRTALGDRCLVYGVAMAERPEEAPNPPKLARRSPVTEKTSIETEEPEVVDKVAALLGKWAEEDR